MITINRAAENEAYSNSDILSPPSALQLMTENVTELLIAKGVQVENFGDFPKFGIVSARVPEAFKTVQHRDAYQRLLRMLSIKEAGAPHTPIIREEFEVAAVTAYRNKSHHIFYIDAMYRAFMENMILDVHKDSIGYEIRFADRQFSREAAEAAYVTAFDNVLRFHPLYVAYLYGVNGDPEREKKIIHEATDYMAWLFQQVKNVKATANG